MGWRKEGCKKGKKNEQKNERIYGLEEEWIEERMNRRMKGFMDQRKNGQKKE